MSVLPLHHEIWLCVYCEFNCGYIVYDSFVEELVRVQELVLAYERVLACRLSWWLVVLEAEGPLLLHLTEVLSTPGKNTKFSRTCLPMLNSCAARFKVSCQEASGKERVMSCF